LSLVFVVYCAKYWPLWWAGHPL